MSLLPEALQPVSLFKPKQLHPGMTHTQASTDIDPAFEYWLGQGLPPEDALYMSKQGKPSMASRLGGFASDFLNEIGPAGLLSFAPGVGDAAGLAADAQFYADNPEERTLGNFGLSALGLLPFVPGVAMTKHLGDFDPEKMFVQHNLTADNLRNAHEMGGMPMPSIGISKAGSPLEGYGDIKLIGDPSMVKPSARNPVYSADAYSPTYPPLVYDYPRKGMANLNDILSDMQKEHGLRTVYGDNLSEGPRSLAHEPAVIAKFLDERGELPDLTDLPDSWSKERALFDSLNGKRKELDQYASELFKEIGAKEKLFDGYTNMGNRRYKAHTAENVLKMMRRDMKKNQTGMFGSGALRAQVAPKFRSMKEIKDNRGRLISEGDWQAKKSALNDEMNNKLIEISGKFNDYAIYKDTNPFIQGDMIRDQLTEIATGGGRWDEYFNDVPDELKKEWMDYLEELKAVPTTYFEAKPNRIVGLNEFKGAMIPEGSAYDQAENILRNYGVLRISRFKDEKDKLEKLREYQDLMFGLGGVGLLGGLSYQQEETQ